MYKRQTLHRTDSEGADYYFIYNANKEATTGTVTLQGTGVPYFLDAWTGEITPIAQYTTDGSSVTFEITLDKNDAHIYAIAPDQQNFGTGLGVYATGSTAEDGEIVYDNGAAVYRSNTPGTAEVTLSLIHISVHCNDR